ncbi:MAG TPA: GAF domain-containing protein [Dermatophilaceae bacterium]|nr:GAF domain-containing protein [Dermatophilaceae bacterium]
MPLTMRSEVAASWHRSAAAGVQVDAEQAQITLPEDDLQVYREAHPLAPVFPLLDDVLGRAAEACDAVMAVSDASGQLLWVSGSTAKLRQAERIGFVAGSNWDERLAGTNAPGTALVLDRPTQVTGEEHFRESVRPWSCVAAPIHDPVSRQILGVLDITGGADVAVPQTLAMVRAAAHMAEAELARTRLVRQVAEPRGGSVPSRVSLQLECLGRREALLGDLGGARTLRLTPRHSEVLVLLAAAPTGLTGDELAVLLHEQEVTPSTMRAELNRLKAIIGEEVLGSRPYRLRAAVSGDWHRVHAHLATGEVLAALRDYRGPLLPRSTAPGVVRLREELQGELRQAVLASGQADLMAAWTRSSWGVDDYEMWSRQRERLDPRSPLQPLVHAQLARLDREAGVVPLRRLR